MTPTAVVLAVAAASSSSSAANKSLSAGSNLKIVGILLAVFSGTLIGSSFVFKKKGLLRSQADGVAGEGVAYLKSPLWWTGMIMMILGELCNFAAYAFVEAIVVTPLGALSVVISAILSSFFLNEKLTFFGWLGCGLCVLGSIIIALNGPESPSVGYIKEFEKLFLAPGFLVWGSALIIAAITIVVFMVPKYGKKSMLWYILVCSMIGGISVSVTSGLGAAIVTTAYGENQFKHWFIYFLLGFVTITLVTEVYYLNCALALFNTAMVTPTYYVTFTFFSIVTTIVLFQGLHAPVRQIITLVLGFLVICFGIVILQMSKIDPLTLGKLDRRSTLLLQAARAKTESLEEKSVLGAEDPGMDTLRGSFGAVGSIIRARSARRLSQASSTYRVRPVNSSLQGQLGVGMGNGDSSWSLASTTQHQPPLFSASSDPLSGMKRHQLYDTPMPSRGGGVSGSRGSIDMHTTTSSSVMGSPSIMSKRQTIKFGDEDLVHQYDRPGTGDRMTEHHRKATTPQQQLGSASPGGPPLSSRSGGQEGYPPLPTMATATPSRGADGLPSTSARGWSRSVDDLEPVEESGSSRSASETVMGGIGGGSGRVLQLELERLNRDDGLSSDESSTGSQTHLMDTRYLPAAENQVQSAPPYPSMSMQSSPAPAGGALGILGAAFSGSAVGSGAGSVPIRGNRNSGSAKAPESMSDRRLRAGSTQSATLPAVRTEGGIGNRDRRGTDAAGRGDARKVFSGFTQSAHVDRSHDRDREILRGSDVESLTDRGKRGGGGDASASRMSSGGGAGEQNQHRPKLTTFASSGAKRYPRRKSFRGGEADVEESESLWKKGGTSNDDEVEGAESGSGLDSPMSPSLSSGGIGIRLVTAESAKGRF